MWRQSWQNETMVFFGPRRVRIIPTISFETVDRPTSPTPSYRTFQENSCRVEGQDTMVDAYRMMRATAPASAAPPVPLVLPQCNHTAPPLFSGAPFAAPGMHERHSQSYGGSPPPSRGPGILRPPFGAHHCHHASPYWENFGRNMEQWGETFGRDMERWGEQFGRDVETAVRRSRW